MFDFSSRASTIGITPTPWFDIRAELETEAQARAWELAWPVLRQRVKNSTFVLMPGLGAVIADAEVERNASQLHIRETVTEGEAMRVLQLATRLIRTHGLAGP